MHGLLTNKNIRIQIKKKIGDPSYPPHYAIIGWTKGGMTSEGLGEMFEGDSADMCAGKFLLVSMGGRAEGLACTDPGARTPNGASGNFASRTSSMIRVC